MGRKTELDILMKHVMSEITDSSSGEGMVDIKYTLLKASQLDKYMKEWELL